MQTKRIWLREPSDSEEDSKARVIAMLSPVEVDPMRTGMAAIYATPRLTADYGERDE